MDVFGLLDIPNWILVFVVIFYVCYLYMTLNHGVFESLGVPHPKPLPIFGNLLQDLRHVTFEKDIENAKMYGRIYGFYEFNQPTLRVTDPTILKEVFVKQFNNFTNRRNVNMDMLHPVLRKLMSIMRGEEWKMTRNVMTPTFTSGKLKQMVSLVDKCTQRFMEMLAMKADKGDSLDAKDIYISYLLEVVGTCAFGIELNTSEQSFVKNARRLMFDGNVLKFSLFTVLPRRLHSLFGVTLMDHEALNRIKDMLKGVIKVRETGNKRRNDFLQLMLDAVSEATTNPTDDEKKDADNQEIREIKAVLTPDGVLAQCVLFLRAGFETTSTTLSFISYNAATNQDCQAKLLEEIDRVLSKNDNEITWDTIAQMAYMDMFILETLRMYPPATRIDRHCSQDTTIGDLLIPKGFIVNVPIYALHHDDEFYPDPYKFDPERFSAENKQNRNPYTYLAFGIGPRNCIGMRFALMVLKITLVHVLKDFRFCRSSDTQEPIVFSKGKMQLIPVGGIHVKLIRRDKNLTPTQFLLQKK